ncbi:MAG: peptidoglycan editing factor PgeF [bacterium]|nr:peptidoglycan editing factor PgeF [bacterium]
MRDLMEREAGGVAILHSPLLDGLGFAAHAFSTRQGGVSEGRFDSLNLGPAEGEPRERVAENRRRFLSASGLAPVWIAEAKQVHGAEVIAAEKDPFAEVRCGDALMTDVPGVLVTVQTADCLPVLFADPKRRAVAAVHAGRQGIAEGVLAETVRRMEERFGSSPGDLVAALGPAISGEVYEVGEECVPPFRRRYRDWRDFCLPAEGGKWLLDLNEAARRQIAAAGVPADQIGSPGPCTYRDAGRFYSYRRDGAPTGRLMAAIGVF